MFLAIDGNGVGKIIEKLIVNQDMIGLNMVSNLILNDIKEISEIILKKEGIVHMSGGDNILAECELDEEIIRFITLRTEISGLIYSIGYGRTALKAYLALKIAKASNVRLICYEEHVLEADKF